MNRRRWFMRFLFRALSERAGRVAVASLSVTIAVAIVVSAFGISMGIREKLGHELKAYGANILVSAPSGGLNADEADALLTRTSAVAGHSLQLYGSARVQGVDLELMGMDLKWASGWKLEGVLPEPVRTEALVGSNIQEALGLESGDEMALSTEGGVFMFRAVGFVERGGPEDSAIMLWLGDAQSLLQRPGKASAALVRAVPGRVEEAVEAIRAGLPGARVKTLKQVALAEEKFIARIELLMALVSVVVLISASISLSSTMSATVIERLKEIALMKAIGGTSRGIGMFFISEGVVIGVLGGLAGYLIGALSAIAVSSRAFGSMILVPPYFAAIAVGLGVVLSVAASFMPLAGALRHKPSVILRGE